jgi:hypothetical protein
MTVRSYTTMAACLDFIMAGMSVAEAAHSIGARSASAVETWRAKSRQAEAAGDESIFFFAWPTDSEKEWFHNLVDRARARRGELLSTPLLRGLFKIEDGRIAFERGDFGEILLDGNGVPIAVPLAVVEVTLKGTHRPNPDDVYAAMHKRRELAPASYSGNKPKAVPAYVGSALGDYLKGSKMTVDKQPTPLRKELEAKLAEARANPNRASAKARPIAVLGRREDGPQERVSNQSDQRGLPTQMADAPRREAPQPKSLPVDYSRRGPNVRLDAPGRG